MSEIIKKETNKYLQTYKQKMSKKTNFLSRLKIKNSHLNKEFSFNNNGEYIIKADYMYLVYNSIGLQKKFESNAEYTAVFITNTLESSFHKFKQLRNGSFIKNPKFEDGNTINLGYRILNDFFKQLYKNFKVNNKYEKLEFVKVIEPHKSYTAHLHAIVFVKNIHLQGFQEYYERLVNNHFNLGTYKFEVINNTSRSASYILKYAQKNFIAENEKFKVYYGWKLENKIRAYTFTRQFIPRDMFNKLSFHLSKKFALDEDSYDEFSTNNFYELVHNFTNFTQDIIDTETGEIKNKSKVSNEDDMFFVNVQKQRKKVENCHNAKIVEIEKVLSTQNISKINTELEKYNLLNRFNNFVKEETLFNYLQLEEIVYLFFLYKFLEILKVETRYSYKIVNYTIHKQHHQYARYDVVYNKDDWSISKK